MKVGIEQIGVGDRLVFDEAAVFVLVRLGDETGLDHVDAMVTDLLLELDAVFPAGHRQVGAGLFPPLFQGEIVLKLEGGHLQFLDGPHGLLLPEHDLGIHLCVIDGV